MQAVWCLSRVLTRGPLLAVFLIGTLWLGYAVEGITADETEGMVLWMALVGGLLLAISLAAINVRSKAWPPPRKALGLVNRHFWTPQPIHQQQVVVAR